MSNKLELTWVGKNERTLLEPRILISDDSESVSPARVESNKGDFDNKLIFGDNLLALKALEAEYAGKIKCVFIDPPYNTGSAFEHYDDGVEHSTWLSLIRDRLEIIRSLISDDGSLWITIDDREGHYLKVLCDEVFGRKAFIANIVWQKRTSRENRAAIGSAHDHVLLYSKHGKDEWKKTRNLLPSNDEGFSNPDNDPKGEWRSIPFSAQGFRKNQMYKIKNLLGVELDPPKDRCWGATEAEFLKLKSENRVYFPKDGAGRPRIKKYRGEEEGLVPMTWWDAAFAGDNEAAKKEVLALSPETTAFGTPKPELLIHRILTIATNPGDLVLDSFAGSGTTGAVAHKMGRRWIMIEMGEHCHTHIIPRLKKVISGEDQGGISKEVGWRGGGGFRYFRLAKSLMKKDRFGQWVINREEYNAEKLAEAVCKIEGFTYDPSSEVYWQHGHSTENDFIYVTTQSLTNDHFASLSHDVGEGRSLLVICGSYDGSPERFKNLTVKVLRRELVGKYEWGRETYALNVVAATSTDDDADEDSSLAVEDFTPVVAKDDVKKKRGRPAKAKPADANQLIDFGSQP